MLHEGDRTGRALCLVHQTLYDSHKHGHIIEKFGRKDIYGLSERGPPGIVSGVMDICGQCSVHTDGYRWSRDGSEELLSRIRDLKDHNDRLTWHGSDGLTGATKEKEHPWLR